MQGIREHHIQYVVVIDGHFSFYLPQELICFDLLHAAYPETFLLVEAKPPISIYEVLPDSAALSVNRRN